MGIANMFVRASSTLEDAIRPSTPGRDLRFLTIGTMDFWATWGCLKRHGIRTISAQEIRQHEEGASSKEFFPSSKRLCAQFFRHFGYDSYGELDINDRADVVWDLNRPIPLEMEGRYDFVLNVSGQYAMNAIQSYWNTMKMVKVGGKLMVHSHLGDMTNRFYLSPSPDFLIDFHTANGFVLEKAILQNRTGYSIPYERTNTKVTFVSTIIPFRFFLAYYPQLFLRDLSLRRYVAQMRRKEKRESTPGLNNGKSELHEIERRQQLKTRLTRWLGDSGFARLRRMAQTVQRWKQQWSMIISPDWVVWCVFQKVEEVSQPRFEIITTYRDHHILGRANQPETIEAHG